MENTGNDCYEPTVEDVALFRRTDPQSLFMNDAAIVKWLKKKREPAPPPKPEGLAWPDDFTVPTRSKRGALWPKSVDNPANVAAPDQGYLLPEVDLTPPDKAGEMLVKRFDGLNTGSAEDIDRALKLGVVPAVRACIAMNIDPARVVVFPWIKRSALKRIGRLETEHHGALIEAVVFPRLEQVYGERGLAFTNWRAGKMATDNYLQMTDEVAEWLKAREDETAFDICFSAALLDAFHGFSVDATRHETKKAGQLVDGTCFVVQQMLLTQSQLLAATNHQRWDMPGDKYDPNGASSFSAAPYCGVNGGKFGFALDGTDDASTACGALVLPFAVF